MPGMAMPHETWLGAAAGYLGMWMAMMVPMMLPSAVPMLARYRRSVPGSAGMRLHGLTALAGAGYVAFWAAIGLVVFAAREGLLAVGTHWEAPAGWLPVAAGVTLLAAGAVQLTPWKARQLARCRDGSGCARPPVPTALAAWRQGLGLGVRCSLCCGSLMVALLAIGLMDPVAMAVATLVIAAERLAPAPRYVARAAGAAIVVAGLLMIARVWRPPARAVGSGDRLITRRLPPSQGGPMMTSRIALSTALVASALVPGGAAVAQGPVNVVITLRGDVGQYAGMCEASGGEDKLSGGLQLISFDQDDGSALYRGTLARTTAVDACGTQPNPTEDQVKMCVAHLDGSARMEVTLEVYGDDRGAWVKSEPLLAPALRLTKRIAGCPEAGEWLNAYPKDGIMSGLAFEDVPSGYLRGGTYGTPELELLVY